MSAGGTVEASAFGFVQARLTTDRLVDVASAAAVARVRAPAPRAADAVVDGEGVDAINARAWHGTYTGAGVKIAIIDLGFAGYQALLGTELPATVTTVAEPGCAGKFSTGEDHGTAVAEIVHEVAPGAELHLICIDTEVDLALAEQYVKAQGIRIVNHSVSWFNTSGGDGTGGSGTPDAIVADARANGILWVNSAGNQGGAHWNATWSDPDDDGVLWVTSSAYAEPGETVCLFLRWNAWPSTTEDYDLYLFAPGEPHPVASSTDSQADHPGPPTEAACYTNETAAGRSISIRIVNYSAWSATRLELFAVGSHFHWSTGMSLTEPATSPAALAVAAECVAERRFEIYSSYGPTVDARPKPEALAPGSVSTATYGPSSGCEDGFAGTSAAAPHVAAAAALIKQRFPTLSAAAVTAVLAANSGVSSALPHDAPGGLFLAPLTALRQWAAHSPGPITVNGDGTYPWRIPNMGGAGRLSFSPDGSKMVFRRSLTGGNDGDVWIANADGTDQRPLTTDSTVDSQAVWSPDGSKILFARVMYEPKGLYTINADGTGQTKISSTMGWDPVYSPNGAKIALSAWDAGHRDVYVMNADGSGGVTALTLGTLYDAWGPTFSPDGTKIAYTGVISSTPGSTSDIWVMNVDGSAKTKIISSPSYDASATWTPDGAKIAFLSTGSAARST